MINENIQKYKWKNKFNKGKWKALLKKIETNEETIKQNKKEIKNINKLLIKIEEEIKENNDIMPWEGNCVGCNML